MAEPDRQKMMMRLNNLNVTLESLYRLAWQDGFEAGKTDTAEKYCWNCYYYHMDGHCSYKWTYVDRMDGCFFWKKAEHHDGTLCLAEICERKPEDD